MLQLLFLLVSLPFSLSKVTPLDFDLVSKFSAAVWCDKLYEIKTYSCGQLCLPDAVLQGMLVDNTTEAKVIVTTFPPTGTIFVAFQGMHSLREKIEAGFTVHASVDFLPSATSLDERKIHLGFKTMYGSLRSGLFNVYSTLTAANPGYEIIFTGWSLGGALANIASIDFYEQYPQWKDRISVYTFGAPRTGNHEWAVYCNSLFSTFRLFYVNDFVPTIPKIGYEHVQTPYRLNEDGSIEKCPLDRPDSGESSACSVPLDQQSTSIHYKYYYHYYVPDICVYSQ